MWTEAGVRGRIDRRRPRRSGGGAQRLGRFTLGLLSEAQPAASTLRGVVEYPAEATSDPASRLGRRRHDQRPLEVDGDEREPLKPDLERALTDRRAGDGAYLLPGGEIRLPRRPQSCAHRGEVDGDQAPALATALGDVGLLDQDLVARLPPSGGLGGSSRVLGLWGSLPARAIAAGFSAGFSGERVRS